LKITNHKLCQFIVKKYVKQNINWAKEVKIAQSLIKQYKEYSFWNNLELVKLPSLAWFLTDEGKKFINTQIKIHLLKETKRISYDILEEKINEDKKTCQKPKTIIQFIKSWEENQKKSN
jgi:hypothetical protein